MPEDFETRGHQGLADVKLAVERGKLGVGVEGRALKCWICEHAVTSRGMKKPAEAGGYFKLIKDSSVSSSFSSASIRVLRPPKRVY